LGINAFFPSGTGMLLKARSRRGSIAEPLY
jgi:hypothetical protein